MIEYLKIIFICIGLSIIYGITHDLVTAHICVEYFSVFHPTIIDTDNPIALALIWGVIATWWVGLGLGIPLSIVCRVGKHNKLNYKSVLRPMIVLLFINYTCAMIAGLIGLALSKYEWIQFSSYITENLTDNHLHRYAFDLFAHNASYTIGSIGGVILIILTLKKRIDTIPVC